ncbi:uncharacterized protein N7482_005523 [Penicillium canariense]|uniref:Uncharacterized protein n=1 Tax=Penicillium canariense TaxID=189055 RepID=A0A9W9I840_9EURO|nr:uncharacterized protein N7482_005523 [Penicillium canariense]KAJ5166742.1 hypothetical protein N7482_005523 [Penicillium canariense]
MTPPDDFSIVAPPPSFPLNTYGDYQPFDAFFDKTVNRILSEEASLEESRHSDLPFDSSPVGSGNSPSSYSLRSRDNCKRPTYISASSTITSKTKKKNRKKTRSAAKREITVIDLCGSDDEDLVGNNVNRDQDECDHTKEMKGDDHVQPNGTPQDDSDHASTFVEAIEGSLNGVSEQDTLNDECAEEDRIFSSVGRSERLRVLNFIAGHPFMHNPVQPIQRSARLHFTDEICRVASSVGLDSSSIKSLVKHVRKLYLEFVCVDAEPPAMGLDDMPFGNEIVDEVEPTSHTREGFKRNRDHMSPSPSLNGRRSKRRVCEPLESSPQAVETEVIQAANGHVNPPPTALRDAPDYANDQGTTMIQIESSPEVPIDAVVVHDEEKGNEPDTFNVQNSPKISHEPVSVKINGKNEKAEAVQVESTPELPLESGDATAYHEAQISVTEHIFESTFPHGKIAASDNGKADVEDVQIQTAHNPATVGESLNDESVPDTPHESDASPGTVMDMVQEGLLPKISPEPTNDSPLRLSRNQKRKEKKRLRKQRKREEKERNQKKEAEAQQQSSKACLEDHNRHHAQEASAKLLRKNQSSVSAQVSSNGPPAKDPEPRKERKRRKQEYRLQQKRERKLQRKYSTFQHDRALVEDAHSSADELPVEATAFHLHERCDDGGNRVPKTHDEPKAQLSISRQTPEREGTVAGVPMQISTPRRDRTVAKGLMQVSTPTSQGTPGSQSKYGPLSPDPKEWSLDF